MADPLLNTEALSARWGMSLKTLANLRCKGEGPAYVKIGNRILYRLADVIAYEDARLVRTLGVSA